MNDNDDLKIENFEKFLGDNFGQENVGEILISEQFGELALKVVQFGNEIEFGIIDKDGLPILHKTAKLKVIL
jgi:hypothetical protein